MKRSLVKSVPLALIILISFGIVSCKKDPITGDPTAVETAVFVTNEGQFSKNQASISLINLTSNTVIEDIYGPNNAEVLGDIAQSVTVINGKIYAVINNSGKIVVINPTTYKKEAEITGLGYPQNITAISASQALVTDLFGGPIKVINLTTNAVTSTITVQGGTGEMIVNNGKTYITCNSSEYLYVFDNSLMSITDSVLVGKGAQTMQLDNNQKLWVGFSQLYDANYNVIEQGKLKKVNLTSKAIELNFVMTAGGVKRVKMNGDKTNVYYLNRGVYSMSTSSSTVPSAPLFTKTGASYNSLGFDTQSNLIYVGDAKDYTSNGSVYQVSTTGELKNTFTVGVSPSDFYFFHK